MYFTESMYFTEDSKYFMDNDPVKYRVGMDYLMEKYSIDSKEAMLLAKEITLNENFVMEFFGFFSRQVKKTFC